MQWDIQIFWYEGTINSFPQGKSLRFATYQSNSKCGWGSAIQTFPQQFWPILVSVENLVVFIVANFYGNS